MRLRLLFEGNGERLDWPEGEAGKEFETQSEREMLAAHEKEWEEKMKRFREEERRRKIKNKKRREKRAAKAKLRPKPKPKGRTQYGNPKYNDAVDHVEALRKEGESFSNAVGKAARQRGYTFRVLQKEMTRRAAEKRAARRQSGS